jgi:putative intracellular protease/amidase
MSSRRAHTRRRIAATSGITLGALIAGLALHAQQDGSRSSFPASAPSTPERAARADGGPPVIAIVGDSAGTEITDFMIPRATLAESGIARVVTVAPKAGAIRLGRGTVSVEPDMTFAAFDAAHPAGADYVVVPALADRNSPVIAAWLRAQAGHGATIVAICDGAWTVASAGLLAGHRATGHWHSLDDLAQKYPGTTWVRDHRYVVDGRVITTTGVSASLPASMMLVERIGGRASAAATARRIGVARWDDTHHTDDFAVTKWMYVRGVANALAWWRHDAIAVPVVDGVDEIALALTLDAIPRTMRGQPITWSADGGPVTGRQGLRMSVDRGRAAVPADAKEMRLPASPASALDTAIATLSAWYGPGAGRLVAMGMEYHRATTR